jgi:hypothetical protein
MAVAMAVAWQTVSWVVAMMMAMVRWGGAAVAQIGVAEGERNGSGKKPKRQPLRLVMMATVRSPRERDLTITPATPHPATPHPAQRR